MTADNGRLEARAWPREGTPLQVRLGADPALAQSLARALTRNDLVVAAPVRLIGGSAVTALPPEDGRVMLFWESPAGRGSLAAQLQDHDRHDWVLRPLGPGQLQQRRAAVREKVRLPMTFTAGAAEVPGHTVDISETGLRAVLVSEPPTDRATVVHLTLDGVDLSVPFVVLRCEQTDSGTWVVTGRFNHSPRVADVIRRYVFTRQRQAIRRGL